MRTSRPARLFLLAALVSGCATSPPRQPATLGAVYGAALSGDFTRGVAMLHSIDPAALGEADRAKRECLLSRFERGNSPAPQSGDEMLDGLLGVYRTYWTDSLLKRRDKATLETNLLVAIDGLSYHYARVPPTGSIDESTSRLVGLLKARGSHAITGVTLPFHELMAWRRNDERLTDIVLPEGSVKVKVVLMDDFASLGWSAWATCDRAFSGGWATKEAIFAVRQAYDLESESYRVSLLAHEGQHFSDYARFPKLEQPELEYRAKLTEIALSQKSTGELLGFFAGQVSESREAPHAWANARVIANLRRELGGQDPTMAEWVALRAAARKLLRANTSSLSRAS